MFSLYGRDRLPNDFWDQDEWLMSHRSTVKEFVALALTFVVIGAWARTLTAPTSVPQGSWVRAAGQGALACGMLFQMSMDWCGMPPKKKTEPVYGLKKVFASLPYLTFWILVTQTAIVASSAIGEMSLLGPAPALGLLVAGYKASVFAGTLGIMLTLMFLKLCYFEKGWQTYCKEFWEGRGFPVGRNTLMSHCFSLPIGVLDVVVKDKAFLRACTPSFLHTMLALAIFAALYFYWIHVTFAVCGIWPYPLLYKFDTFVQRHALWAGIFVVGTLVLVLEYGLAAIMWSGH